MLKESHRKSLWIVFNKSAQTISELEATTRDASRPWNLVVCAGVGVLLGDLYMSIERILRLLLESVCGEKITKGEAWHKQLIDAGNEKGFLPQGIESTLQGMRGFRHLLTHGYGIDMDEADLRGNIPEAIRAYREIEAQIIRLFPELLSPIDKPNGS
jgi:uncharacterized protein YutE (UPF0331/DUF86 family)